MAEHAHITAGRRSLFGAAAALLITPAAMASGLTPDTQLISACREYIVALQTYDQCGGILELEDDPLWQHIMSMEAKILSLEPQTVAGVVALAEVAMNLARQPDGRDNFSSSFTGEWPELVVRALVRVAGGRMET